MKNTEYLNEIMGIKSKFGTVEGMINDAIGGTIDDAIDDVIEAKQSSNFRRGPNGSEDNDDENGEGKNRTCDAYGIQTNINQLSTAEYFASKMKEMRTPGNSGILFILSTGD